MPKNINTPREELICGKLDVLFNLILDGNKVDAIEYLQDIRHDAQRMEQKLIIRKQEVEKLRKELYN